MNEDQILYEVQTDNYKNYYVLASSYNEAEEKVLSRMAEETDNQSILTTDGSLNLNYKPPQIRSIRDLGKNFIL